MIRAKRLTGRCADGAARDKGFTIHAVPDGEGDMGRALCHAIPGRLSNGWVLSTELQLSCKRCNARLRAHINRQAGKHGQNWKCFTF